MPNYKVQKQVASRGRTQAGQKNMAVGEVWETIATKKNKTVAERIARGLQVDNPDGRIRIHEVQA